MRNTKLSLIFVILISITNLNAQEKTVKDIEKAAQNPIASMYVIPIQNNTEFGISADNRVQNVTNVQPVVPVGLGNKVNMIIRTIIPIINQPLSDDKSKFGLGDVALSLFFTPRKPGKLIWGVGPAIGIPTATDSVLGTGKLSAGPAVIWLIQPRGWTIGFIVQNTWSIAGSSDRQNVNSFYSQVFIVKNIAKGWYVNSSPIITQNWEAEYGWLVPIGAGFGKVFRMGKLPVNAQVGYYNYLVSPDNGPAWQLRVQLSFMFPK